MRLAYLVTFESGPYREGDASRAEMQRELTEALKPLDDAWGYPFEVTEMQEELMYRHVSGGGPMERVAGWSPRPDQAVDRGDS